jgi:hypothetical protein
MPSAAVMDTIARIQAATPGSPLMIPGAFTPRMQKPSAADVGMPTQGEARAEAVPLHDRAQVERELEGGGALRYRRPGGHRGLATRLFDLLLRTTP